MEKISRNDYFALIRKLVSEGRPLHWLENLSYQFAAACGFTLETLNGLSEYAFSDKQLSLFTYCEGDITFSPYKDEELYKKRKMEMINFYNKEEENVVL